VLEQTTCQNELQTFDGNRFMHRSEGAIPEGTRWALKSGDGVTWLLE